MAIKLIATIAINIFITSTDLSILFTETFIRSTKSISRYQRSFTRAGPSKDPGN